MAQAELEVGAIKRISPYHLLLLLIAILFATYARATFLIIYPAFVAFLFYVFHWKLSRNAIYLFALVFICWLLSFRDGFFLKYNIISFYFFIPFFALILAIPRSDQSRDYLAMLMNALAIVAVVNNVIGFIQYIAYPNDDSFAGVYGTFTVSQNGLSIINALLFFYYFSVYLSLQRPIYLCCAIFFLVSMIMGFYGAGLIVLLFSLTLTFLRITVRNIIRITILAVIAISLIVVVMQLVSPATLEYNVNIIKRFTQGTGMQTPRKLIIFQNYITAYTSSALDFLFGSGPGTFNSRSAFMVGSPTYFNVEIIKSAEQPFYFRNYAYTLWNSSNTGPYDGFMNQPFSSILALAGEFGLVVTFLLAFIIYRYGRFWINLGHKHAGAAGLATEARMFKFTFFYLLLLIVIDNYIEYPEITALVILIMKLSQQRLKSIV